MKLIDPKGTRISVSDEVGEQLLKRKGYRKVEADLPAVPAAPARRRSTKDK